MPTRHGTMLRIIVARHLRKMDIGECAPHLEAAEVEIGREGGVRGVQGFEYQVVLGKHRMPRVGVPACFVNASASEKICKRSTRQPGRRFPVGVRNPSSR